ncbi:hypothetical protein [Vulcanisaeta thermophila]|uniref:hypothetical protein n=1 Tax=Vulcanisaeta thermophila TaxID=867917 RepID=UPI000853638A|nr:hypothetical protein [Vulcanisaeta thermophila]
MSERNSEGEEELSRTTIMVPRTIANELSRIAKSRGKTIFYAAGEGLKLTAELIRDGFEPSDLLHFWRLYKILSSMDVIPMPMKLIEEVCELILGTLSRIASSGDVPEKLRAEAVNALNNLWGIYEKYGTQTAALISTEFNNLEDLLEAMSRMTRLFAVRHLEVKKLNQDTIELMAIGPSGVTDIDNKILSSFIKGFVNYYGYDIVSEDLRANVMRIVLKRKA